MLNQEELRKKCKFLKWNKGINYYEIAKAIGMKTYSFYNFISGKKVDLGYQREWELNNYLKERIKNE